MLLVLPLLMPCVGCGGKPDPREHEDFVDTTDPDAVGGMLDSATPGEESKPDATAGEAEQ